MKVDLYRGDGRVFAVLPEGVGTLPERHGPWTAFKTIEIAPGMTVPGLDVDECLADLDQFGIYVTEAHVRITEKALGQRSSAQPSRPLGSNGPSGT